MRMSPFPPLMRRPATLMQVTAVDGGAPRQGALSGRLEQGVYFSNRQAPLTRPADRTVPVVSEADIANATEHLEQALPAHLPPP